MGRQHDSLGKVEEEEFSPLHESLAPLTISEVEISRMRGNLLASLKNTRKSTLPAEPNTVRSSEGSWQYFAPLVDIKILRRDEETMTALLKFSPNAIIPAHHHLLEEECFILEGEIYMGDTLLRAGDYQSAYQGTQHTSSHTKTGCLMLLRTHTNKNFIQTSNQVHT